MLRYLLFFNLLYVVDEIHMPLKTGIPAVAPVNLLMLMIWLSMRNKPDQLENPPKPFLQDALIWFFGALGFAFLLAQVRAFNDPIADATYLKNACFYPLYYFVYLRCRQDEKTTRQLIIWVLIIAAVAGLEAVREGFDYGLGHYNPFRRASGPFGDDWHNANRAGVFYAMFTPMFMALALFLRNKKLWRLAAIVGVVLLAGGALFTYSRQSYFMILLAIALLLLRRSIIMSVIIGALLVSLVTYLPDSVTQRVDETEQKDKSGNEEVDASTSSRWEIWGGAMGMWRDHPLGAGLNRFKKEIGNYCSHKGYDAHNFYVLTLAECGPQGLITLLFLIFTLFRLALWLRRHQPPDDSEINALTLGFLFCTMNVMLGGIYGSPTLEGKVMAPYWALCGLLERYIQLKMQKSDSAPTPKVVDAIEDRFPLAAHLPGQK